MSCRGAMSALTDGYASIYSPNPCSRPEYRLAAFGSPPSLLPNHMTVCIQYSRPASGDSQNEVFGLDVAVNNFLSAYFKYGTQEKFVCRPVNIESFEHFKS